VSMFGVSSAMLMTAIGFVLVAILVVICLLMEKRENSIQVINE
jgi:TsgA-like MFS transporter